MESYAQGETSPPLLEETIGANLERIVAKHGEREALVDVATGRRWTYAEFDSDVNALARGLLATGIATGDRVGIWAPNCAEWTVVQYATAKIGAILVNVNPAYRTHELSYALNQSGLRLLFSAQEFKSSDYRAMLVEVGPEAHALEKIVYLGTDDWKAIIDAGADLPDDAVAQRMATLAPNDPINISTPPGPRATRRAPLCRTGTSSTTDSLSLRQSTSPSRTGSPSRCRSTIASGW